MIRIKTIKDILIEIEDKYHLTQLQLSKRVGVSSAYVSAVKSGAKSMPKSWVTRIQELFPDCEFSNDELINAFELSKSEISFPIKGASMPQKLMALQMSNKFANVPDELATKITKMLAKL